MLLRISKKITSMMVLLFYFLNTYSQIYNNEVEAKLIINTNDNVFDIKAIAVNKTKSVKHITYKLSVFKTDKNNNKSNNQQSGTLDLDVEQSHDLSETSIYSNSNSKIIILLLLYDSNNSIIGKDRVVFNEDDDVIKVKESITKKVIDISSKLALQAINNEVEAKIQTNQTNEFTSINATAYNKTEITQSLIYKLIVFNTIEKRDSILEEKNERFILTPNTKIKLATVSFKLEQSEKKIAILLIYDIDKNIIGQDKVVFNDNSKNSDIKKKQILAQLKQKQEKSQDVNIEVKDGIELKGIVIEDTKTKPGRDFYKMFYSLYSQNNINGNRVVAIKEILALGRNTKIEVVVGDEKVFSFFMRPSLDYLKKMNDYAIIRVYQQFRKLEKQSNITKRY